MKREIKIEGMHCSHCSSSVRNALMKIPGVKYTEVNLETGTATIEGDISDADFTEVIESLGFSVKN